MTVQEFKEKYPSMAHLEGNELWNAMEDSFLYAHKNDEIKPVTDWMGNEIKEGQEVVIIKILDKQQFRVGFLIPRSCTVFGEIENYMESAKPEMPCWEEKETLKVIKCEETLNELGYVTKTKSFTFYNTLSTMVSFSNIGNTHILAIKGVSDNEELYLKSLNK